MGYNVKSGQISYCIRARYTSIFRYPLLKFEEGGGCRTSIFSDTPLRAKRLHLVPDWDFVEINPKSWKRKLSYYLTHEDEREEIARRGHETFLKHNTTEIRTRELINFLEKA